MILVTLYSINSVPLENNVAQSVFMGFLGRLDFYREYGFFVQILSMDAYEPDIERQVEFDAASMKLERMTISEVIRAAVADRFVIREHDAVRSLIDSLIRVQKQWKIEMMSHYLKIFSDDWEHLCDKYVETVAALEAIPTIKKKYFDGLKTEPLTLIWMEMELDALDERLRAVQMR